MKTIYCDRDYSEQILDIFNDAILNSTALYDYKQRELESMTNWFNVKEKNNFPVIGIVDDQNKLLGFGSYGTFRNWPAYKYSIEHSLYIHKNYRGQELGKIILSEIIKNASGQDYHCLIAGIDSTNEVSIKLHKSFGFEFCGRIKHAGFKFSKWLDLDFYQLLLTTPLEPNEK
jgi:L-amino acid N-acyltransferase